jgi:hypothetical protein
MINNTVGQLVFRKGGHDLRADVRDSLVAAANAVLKVQGLQGVDLTTITTKTHVKGAFAKFVLTHTVQQDERFDEGYVEGLWRFYSSDEVTEEHFYLFTLSGPDSLVRRLFSVPQVIGRFRLVAAPWILQS